MSRRARLVAAAGLVLAACGEPEPVTVVFVTLEAPASVTRVAELEITVRNAGAAASETYQIAGATFPLTLTVTPTDREGELVIEARASDEAGLPRGAGEARATIVADQRVDVALRLEPADFVVNSAIAGEQRIVYGSELAGRQLAAAPDGSFAVVYSNDCGVAARCDTLARLFAADTTPRVNQATMDDGELIANLTTEFTDIPAVAIGSQGMFIAWTTGDDIKGVALSSAGRHLGFSETVLSAGLEPAAPAVAALASGEYVVVWAEPRPFDDGTVIRGRLVGADGAPAVNPSTGDDADFPVSSADAGFAEAPTVAATGSGRGFVVVWRHADVELGPGNVFARFYGAQGGVEAVREGQLTDYDVADVAGPHVAIHLDGSAVVAWAVDDPSEPRLAGGALLLGRFASPLGVPVSAETVLAAPRRAFNAPALTVRADGAIAAAWHDCGASGDGMGCGVFLQVTRPSGLPVGDPIAVNTTRSGDQTDPSLAAGPDGFLVAWTDASQAAPDPDGTAVRARIVYPAYDVADGRRGATCGGATDTACAESLLCATGADGQRRCHDRCDAGAATPCPGGGTCATTGAGAACVF